jgi:hypothetical protein
VKLTTHLHLVPRSRMRGAISPLPQYVFMVWLIKHRDNFAFTLPLQCVHFCEYFPLVQIPTKLNLSDITSKFLTTTNTMFITVNMYTIFHTESVGMHCICTKFHTPRSNGSYLSPSNRKLNVDVTQPYCCFTFYKKKKRSS